VAGAVIGAFGIGMPLALADGADDRAVAERTLQELERDTAHKDQTADAVQHGREALERANRMRAAGDEAHARLAEGLARRWAELGRDVVRASDTEKHAVEVRRAAMDAGAQTERERALLEEGLARVGRLRAQIEAAEREAKDTHRTAAAAMDAGSKTAAPAKGRDAGRAPGAPKAGTPNKGGR
jgi:hypothetical protein